MQTVQMYHPVTEATITVAEQAASVHEKSGWRVVTDTEPPATGPASEQAPDAEPAAGQQSSGESSPEPAAKRRRRALFTNDVEEQ